MGVKKWLQSDELTKVGGGGGEPGWLNRFARADVGRAGGGGRVAHSAAFWEKVRDLQEEKKEKRKERLSSVRKIQSSAAFFWEQMAKNNGSKWEGGKIEGSKKMGVVKRWEVRSGILEEKRKHWAEGEQHQTIDHKIFF